MIYDIEENSIYYSPSGLPFKVLHLAKHGQDCSTTHSVNAIIIESSSSNRVRQ